MNEYIIAHNFRIIARSLILIMGLIIFSFAFISGIDEMRRGIDDMIMSSPYFLSWLILLTILFVAWVWELAGGIIILVMSLYSFYFFILHESAYGFFLIMITVASLILSVCLLSCWFLDRKGVYE